MFARSSLCISLEPFSRLKHAIQASNYPTVACYNRCIVQTTDVLYPFALSETGEEHIDEAIKGRLYKCLGCSALMVPRKGAIRRWHFAHKPPFTQCADPDKALHRTAVAMIFWGFTNALQKQTEYHLGCPCEQCDRTVSCNVAVPSAKVERERSIVAGTRSDLVISQPGKGPVVIEVVVTHDLEPEAHESYTESGIHVFKVHPSGDTLSDLESSVITDDTLNVPTVLCASCKDAAERQRKQQEEALKRAEREKAERVKVARQRQKEQDNRWDKSKQRTQTTDFLEGLNPAQREAAETIEGPMLIVAGPGSGKTRVITRRIAYMVRVCGISPYRIAAVTFTNKAAREMRYRLERLLGSRAEGLTCSTFHSLCVSILRRDGHHAGLDRSFVIYDDDDTMALLKRAMEEGQIDPKRYPLRAVSNIISGAKSNLIDPAGFAGAVSSYYDEIVLRVYERYESLLRQSRALDFDDLLAHTVRLLQQVPEVLEKYQSRYLHLLIDEFQDTNVAQYALAKLLAGRYRNICVVGDPDQSIYSWRNADIRNILSFQRDYPETKLVTLSENYRSTKSIVEAAKRVIASNQSRLENDLFTGKGQGSPLVVREGHDEDEEARLVVQEVERLVKEEGRSLGDCAVMYRINAQSRAMEEACLRYGMTYRLIGGVRFYQRREVKDVVAYLRVVQNPYDEVSLNRIVNVPSRGIGSRTMEEVTRWAQEMGLPLYAALQAIAAGEAGEVKPRIAPRAVAAIERFVSIIGYLVEQAEKAGAAQLIDLLLERIGYRSYLMEDERGEEQWENVLELKGQAVEVEELLAGEEDSSLAAFLERISLVSDVDSLDESNDALTLITLHQAKGLEFPVVFIIGLEERLLPHSRSMDDPDQMEEERRLFYVGITRAEERLYLFRAFRRRLMGMSMAGTPSRFLADIPRELIEQPAAVAKPWQWTRRRSQTEATTEAGPPLRTGDKVRHKAFGDGIVVNCIASGNDHEATVAFKGSAGVKRLLLSVAPLEKVPAK